MCTSRERGQTGSEDGETATRRVQSSSMQQIVLVCDEVGRLETGQDALDASGWAGLGGAKGGSRRHTQQLTAWSTHRGRRYIQIPAQSGTQRDKGALCATRACTHVHTITAPRVRTGGNSTEPCEKVQMSDST